MTDAKPMGLEAFRGFLLNPDPATRCGALKAAMAYKEPRTVEVVLQALPHETAQEVRAAMVLFVGVVGTPEQLRGVLSLVDDPSGGVRLAAAQAVVASRHPPYFPLLVRLLEDPLPDVREYGGQVLTRLGKDGLLALLTAMLDSNVPWMRLAAVRACRHFRSSSVVALLERALSSADGAARDEAGRVLRRLGERGLPAAADAVARVDGTRPPARAPAVPAGPSPQAGAIAPPPAPRPRSDVTSTTKILLVPDEELEPSAVDIDWGGYVETASRMDLSGIRKRNLAPHGRPGGTGSRPT